MLRRGLGDPVLEDISPFHVERFKRTRTNEGVAPATVNRAVAMLKHFMGMAAKWGWVSELTTHAIAEVKLLKEPPGRVRYLSTDEEKALMGQLKGVVRWIVLTALLTGMRRAEVLRLRRTAIDLSHRQITLTRTKSNKVRRIPINDVLAAIMEEALKSSTGEHVFTNRHGRPYSDNGFRVRWDKAVAKAKLVDFHFHDLRHDFATKLRRKGVGIDVIAQLLGHSSLAMAQRYTHIGQDLLKDAVSKLPAPQEGEPVAAPLPQPDSAESSRSS